MAAEEWSQKVGGQCHAENAVALSDGQQRAGLSIKMVAETSVERPGADHWDDLKPFMKRQAAVETEATQRAAVAEGRVREAAANGRARKQHTTGRRFHGSERLAKRADTDSKRRRQRCEKKDASRAEQRRG